MIARTWMLPYIASATLPVYVPFLYLPCVTGVGVGAGVGTGVGVGAGFGGVAGVGVGGAVTGVGVGLLKATVPEVLGWAVEVLPVFAATGVDCESVVALQAAYEPNETITAAERSAFLRYEDIKHICRIEVK